MSPTATPDVPDFDTVIVGAGVLGCALAHRLVGTGRRVALLDRRTVGSGCSGHAGAIASPLARNDRLRALSAHSRRWYADYRRQRPDAPLRTLPIHFLCAEGNTDALRERCTEPLRPTPEAALPPWIAVPGDTVVLGGPEALHGQVAELCRVLTGSAGVTVYECAPVLGWSGGPGAFTAELSDGRRVRARELVLAKGSWLAAADLPPGAPPPRTKKIVSYVLDLPAGPADPVVYLADHDAFLLPRPERGQWWLSITSPEWDCHPDDVPAASPDDLRIVRAVLAAYAPAAVSALRGASVHCDSYAGDGGPLVTTAPGRPVVVHGGSGSGFRYAPAAADAVLGALEVSR
ncbi:FAD-dependent oxidoreductase [Actinosynnema sp. NPDC047251]|uniref:FAD dependent oxidoreductase n=1 Tax=Saccharothrix espanaensis (strain ATCC 51144 / DSM 44229 / JCM 9112 / NBRC 15066 / NRRL 15764) TaxID=1179773 RepID=K0K726_SACES|nr:FAD-dependent oxidoreductase [Saccharothrix espanaensis]CCH32403.1 FAD dependent oxidoreductase [Saccharothrix espanaensis DSM 44229]